MRTGLAALVLWWLLLVAAGLHSAYYYPKLPAMMATNFDARGNPDGWMAKESFFAVHAITFAGVTALLFAASLSVRIVPDRMISVPNKDYWLAPERREESVAYLFRFLLWINNATMLFLIAIIDSVFRANLAAPVRLPANPWIWAIIVPAFVAGITVHLFLRFRRPAQMGSERT
ncbi:MAG: DUF1648 domain-containing protein [Thermoguttaceae bacterium]|jgi:uncharacterized membrane protein|nr:DUF1648 domain-containing protein [Thermoguttaceae bacterium]